MVPAFFHGEVAEWSKAQHWKCCVPQGTVGSNPTLSAILRSAAVGLSYGLPCVALAKQGWSPTKNLRRRTKDGAYVGPTPQEHLNRHLLNAIDSRWM
jgi:hypothetical protein